MRVLSLGAGVQSSTLLLMACEGEERLDAAIFADTGWEPAGVYAWLDVLRGHAERAGIPLHTVANGNIRQDATGAGRRIVALPLYLKVDGREREGRGRRQCTNEYKITPIRRKLRELGATRARPVDLLLGISLDEVRRMRDADVLYIRHRYPLVDRRMTRHDCQRWLQAHGYPEPQKSACIGCPFRRNAEWRALTPSEFADAAEFDAAIRHQTKAGGWMRAEQYLHRSLVPLGMVDLSTEQERGQTEMDFDGCGVLCANEDGAA